MTLSRQKKIFILIFAVILGVGIFLRAYHMPSWLHFELDQSRDAKIVDLAIKEGPSSLPLLGPKAAGSFLRLGPAYYYFGYISALLFGDTPSGMTVVLMLFGMAAIPVFYLFSRRYFDEKISLGLMAVFSVSLFLVMYSRFSWNPNALPLFIIGTFYCFLRAVDREEKRNGLWLMAGSFLLAIATQLHFVAFVVVPAITFIFLVIKRPKIKLKFWIFSFLLIVFVYIPPIINDVMTGGDNIKQFLGVASKKSTKDDHNILEKAIKDYTENSLGHFLILSGYEKAELPRFLIGKNKKDIICDQECRDNLPLGIAALLIFTSGLALLIKNTIKEKTANRKDFLILVSIWFVVSLGMFLPLAFDISPRFFLLISALPLVFLGFVLEFLSQKISTKWFGAVLEFILAIFIASNLVAIEKRFSQLKKAPYEAVEIGADKILKERDRVTLEQQYMVINYVESIYKQNNYPVYLNSEPFYRRSLLYHLDQRNIPRDDFRNTVNAQKIYAEGNYFLVLPSGSNFEKDITKYADYQEIQRKPFGTLMLIQLEPKKESINTVRQEFKEKKESKSAPGVPKRFKWEEILNDSSEDESNIDN